MYINEKIKLNLTHIKYIALISMLIDHIGAVIVLSLITLKDMSDLIPLYHIMRAIGRISFPLFCFAIVEGFIHTKNVYRYLSRLLIFAVLTELFYDMAFSFSYLDMSRQNVMFTFAISILMLIYMKKYEEHKFVVMLVIAAACAVAHFTKVDYGYIGTMTVATYYVFREKKWIAWICTALLFLNAAVCAPVFMLLYDGKPGKGMKYLFYVFYPLHLLILYMITMYLLGYDFLYLIS